MRYGRSLSGVMEVVLTSAEPEKALSEVNSLGIEMLDIRQREALSYQFFIHRRDYSILKASCKKRGESLHIVRKAGGYWFAKTLFKRPILTGCIFFSMLTALYVPTRVFFVKVEGNHEVANAKILAAAEDCGICFGASRREVRSEKVKNMLLAAIPELQWVGVNTSGCVATVSVRERTEQSNSAEANGVANIVAARDGFILSGTVTNGTGTFSVGQTVKEGQVLISGYTDCGICIRAEIAEGEIFAQTSRTVEAVTPRNFMLRGDLQCTKRKISIIFRKKRINLWKDSGISDVTCGRMYKEYYIALPGGWRLPFALCIEKYHFYNLQSSQTAQPEAEKSLSDFSERYLMQQMIAGNIRDKAQHITADDNVFRLESKYICEEMIGRVRREQIGDINGENS